MISLIEEIKHMESSFNQQNMTMQNRLVELQRYQQNLYPPRRNCDWKINKGLSKNNNQNQNQNKSPLVPLNPNNVVEHEMLPSCRNS